VNIITHERAAAAGVEAFGLWCWGMCWAQIHKSDGRLPRILVLDALRGRRNIMLAKRLVTAGLWIDREDGSWDIRNYIEKNQTAAEIALRLEEKRAANAERQRDWRARRNAPRNAKVTPRNGPTIQTPLPLQTPLQEQDTYTSASASPSPELGLFGVESDSEVRPRDVATAASVRAVYDHWVLARAEVVPDARKPVLSDKRRRAVQGRLREGFTVDDLKLAIDGITCTAFNVEKGFTDLELCCRDAGHVEKYIANAKVAERLAKEAS
jgi:hypothetical protein